ncbi:heterokaryon incompatibility protein-domain-containing protein, partial [Massariosphaeria phaeospora]
MHLLQRQADGSFQLVYRTPNNIPPYAILSHTWEAEEVTFRDMVEGIGTTKAGYRKISFCGKQAASEGLQFFWVDTCCIDKDSSAELTEAINSMFRWYRNAAKCYVYLEDVSADSSAEKFKKSRWFTRGWTLQEMLASKCVEFFSTEGQLIGSKSSRVQEIAEITRIPTEALQGRPLSYFSVEQRMLWTKNRETTLEEDMAYSLLGIFDIHMPLIYGEGKERAFKRLRTEIKYDQENTAVMPLENAQGWLDTTIDKDVLEYSRQRLSDNNGWSKHEEDVALRSDFFKFVLRTPTALHETNKHFKLLMRNSNDKRRPDLIAVKKTGFGERSIEVHVVSGASHYSNFSLQIATPLKYQSLAAQYDFALSDWNGDGTSDLFMIKKNNTGTNSTEVHILSGASDFQDTMLQLGTVLDETDETFAFGMGRWNAGDTPDLFAIKKSKTGTNTT